MNLCLCLHLYDDSEKNYMNCNILVMDRKLTGNLGKTEIASQRGPKTMNSTCAETSVNMLLRLKNAAAMENKEGG